jgi:hypothetical protein
VDPFASEKSDVLREITFEGRQGAPTASEIRKRRAGRKPQYDWGDAELFVNRELDSRGDFDDADQVENWSCQADLERSVADYFSKKEWQSPCHKLNSGKDSADGRCVAVKKRGRRKSPIID